MEEVLDSLRLRITAMFKWAKSEVAGFEDLSPLDQKALLRRTVAELVMLGFARASIAFDGKPHRYQCGSLPCCLLVTWLNDIRCHECRG